MVHRKLRIFATEITPFALYNIYARSNMTWKVLKLIKVEEIVVNVV